MRHFTPISACGTVTRKNIVRSFPLRDNFSLTTVRKRYLTASRPGNPFLSNIILQLEMDTINVRNLSSAVIPSSLKIAN